MTPRPVPEAAPTKPAKLPAVHDTTLSNGLRALAVRKPGVPMVQARLGVRIGKKSGWGDGLVEEIAGETIATGTKTRNQLAIADELQRVGGAINTNVDVEDFFVFGAALATALPDYLSLLADLLQDATHPDEEVALAKAQAEQGLQIAHSQPPVRAAYALNERVFPDHPYGRPLQDPAAVAAVTAAQVRKFQKSMVTPNGSLLVLVGDLPPAKAVAAAEKALGGWTGARKASSVPKPPAAEPGAIRIVHQPGAVQTNIRLGAVGLGRGTPMFPALQIALIVLGGGFTSRLNQNLREDKGYTYGAYASQNHNQVASQIVIQADVQTGVTAPAFVETLYELGRMATTPPSEDELVKAKRYLAGQLALSVQTQAGLASYLTTLTLAGLDLSYLRELPALTEKLTVDDVAEAAATYLSPARLLPVVVGDADSIAGRLGCLGPVEVHA